MKLEIGQRVRLIQNYLSFQKGTIGLLRSKNGGLCNVFFNKIHDNDQKYLSSDGTITLFEFTAIGLPHALVCAVSFTPDFRWRSG